jgi:hypothetical protein
MTRSDRRARPVRARVLTVAAVLAITAAAATTPASAREGMRDPIDLGTLGGPNSFAIGINPTTGCRRMALGAPGFGI